MGRGINKQKRIKSGYYEICPQRTLITSLWCRLLPVFFSRSPGIDILHFHDHLTIHVSFQSYRGYYHKQEFEIPPYSQPLGKG